MAQVAANEVGGRKLIEFMNEHHLSTLLPLSTSINTKTEQALKKAVASLPDGVYAHQVFMDGIDEPLRIAVTITIRGSDITIDFAGTSSQTTVGGINSVYNFTLAYVAHAVKSTLVPDLPNNEGLFSGIRVIAPEGSVVNPRFPAPVMARWMMVSHISSAVFGALAKVAPDRVIADSGTGHMEIVTGLDLKGKRFVYWLVGFGGMGARPTKDGIEATCCPANIGNVPVEIIENVSPIFVTRKEFIQDSGGPGRYRGGCDQAITVKVRSHEPAIINCFLERTAFPALGYWGGMDGRCGGMIVNGNKKINSKQKYILQPGDELTYSQGGGGGFFPAAEREPETVLRDVVNGLVSVEAARELYKVAIDLDRKIINARETELLRTPQQ